MNDEETQATSALALGTLFADEGLRESVNAYVRGQVIETIYQMIRSHHPVLRHVAEHVIEHAEKMKYHGRYEAERRYAEEQEMRAKLLAEMEGKAKIKPSRFKF